jgi:hypothetical protein
LAQHAIGETEQQAPVLVEHFAFARRDPCPRPPGAIAGQGRRLRVRDDESVSDGVANDSS